MGRGSVMVIGGSLGGLFAANLLRAHGWDVHVYERVADDLATRGAGIGTHPELFQVMRRLGITVDESIGVSVERRLCLARDGSVVHETRQPQTMSAWARIYRLLRGRLPDACYYPGVALESVEDRGASVVARFSDGSTREADLLVGADGIRSTVRSLWCPDSMPRYAGYIAWRGVLEESAMPPALHEAMMANYVFGLPPGEMMLCYPVPGRDDDVRPGHRGYNFVWYRPTDEATTLRDLCTDSSGHCHGSSIAPPLIRPEVLRGIRQTARDLLAPTIAQVVELTVQPFFQAINDLESSCIGAGRVALLGDAAFVARPHIGAGVTKAALDAQCLADELEAAGGDVPAALVDYDAKRRRFGHTVVERARWVGGYIETRGRPDLAAGRAMMPETPESALREVGAPLVKIEGLRG